MSDTPAQHAAPDAVPTGITCISCEYDLAGLPAVSPCPECGTPIQNSLKGPLLRFAPADELCGLMRASKWLRIALVVAAIAVLVVLCTMLVFMLAAFTVEETTILYIVMDALFTTVAGVGGVAFLVAGGAYIAGVILLTATGFTSLGPTPVQRILARYSLLLFIPTMPLARIIIGNATGAPSLVLGNTLGVIATLSLITHHAKIRQAMIAVGRRCAPSPKIKPAGVGTLIGALILFACEIRHGWAEPIALWVPFFIFVSLESPIRLLRKSVHSEASHAH